MKIKNHPEKTRIFNQNDYIMGIVILLTSFLFYLKTLAPTILWGDPAKLTNLAYFCYLRLYTANHPLHNLIGHYWGRLPFSDYSFGQNLLSAFFASLAVLLLYFVVYRLTGSVFASAVASLSMTVAHTFWWLAVINESYSLAFFFFLLAILAEINWLQTKKTGWLYLASFAVGMGVSDHYVLAVFAPAFVIAALIDNYRIIFEVKKVLGTIFFFILGTGLLFFLYFTQYPPLTLSYMVEPVAIGSLSKMLREIIRFPLYVFYQFPVAGFILGIAGLWYIRKIKASIFSLFLLIFLIDYLFSVMYMWERQPEMMVFSYIVFAVWIGVGAQAFLHMLGSLKPINRFIVAGLLVLLISAIPLAIYYSAPMLAKKMGSNILGIRTLPYRDNDRYFLLPDKSNYFGAYEFGKEVFKVVEPGSIIIADFTPYEVLLYFQTIERIRPDIELSYTWPDHQNPISQGLVEENINKRPIYLVDIDDYPNLYKTEYLKSKYKFVPKGPLYQIQRKD